MKRTVITQRMTGFLASLVLIALVVGIPFGLAVVAGSPLPDGGLPGLDPTWDSLTQPDDGTLFLAVLTIVGWLAWLAFATSVLVEIGARLRGVRVPQLPALGVPQRAAAGLVSAAALLFTVTPLVAPANPAQATPQQQAPATATAQPPAPAPQAQQQDQAPDKRHQQVPTEAYVVRPGDSMWSIAEHKLGDGGRWTEIARLNRDQVETARWLQPGWTLQLPATRRSASQAGEVVVEPGDTLSEIAHEDLGNADLWPQLYEKNQHVIGSNPNLILPGQIIELPGARTADEDRRRPRHNNDRRGQPSGQGDHPTRSGAGTNDHGTGLDTDSQGARAPGDMIPTPPIETPATAASPSREAADTATTTDEAERGAISALRALLATTACLSAGALGLLLFHRRRQFRERRPGRAIAATPPELMEVERAVLETGGEARPAVEFLDRALRHVATSQRVASLPLPPLGAAVMGKDKLTLLFNEPARGAAPDGWEASEDARAWVLPRATTLEDELLTQPAPYPALVSVGEDQDGRTWLLDLETVGTFGISGTSELVADMTRFLVAELAVNAWSEGAQVLLTGGFGAETIGLNPSRIREIDVTKATRRAMAVAGDTDASRENLRQDLLGLRRDAELLDSTGPLVIVVPGRATAELVDAVAGRSRSRLVVLHDHAEPAIELTGDQMAYLPRWGVSVKPFTLPAEQAQAMGALVMATANLADAPMPQADEAKPLGRYTTADGALRDEFVAPRRVEGDDPTSLLPDADELYLSAAATTVEDLAALAPSVPERTRIEVAALDPALDRDVANWFDAAPSRPKVRVLGPVEVIADGQDRATVVNVGGTIEFIVYLACQERGVTKDRAAEALGWSGATVQNRARDARRFIGTRPDGEDWLPDAAKSQSARQRGVAAYELHPEVLVDADLFRRLRARAQARGAAGLEDLVTALSLVTGEPFDQLRRGGYSWLLEGDRLDHHMCAAISDVAHLVADRALATGNIERARAAAQVAIESNPNSDVARLDMAAIAQAAGDESAEVLVKEQVVDRVDADLTARTEEVLDRRGWLTG